MNWYNVVKLQTYALVIMTFCILALLALHIGQQSKINQLEEQMQRRETTWDKQVKFNETITRAVLAGRTK